MGRFDDRTSRRERVRRGAGGGGHDQPVGGIGREPRTVELDLESHRVTAGGLLQHRLVEGDHPPRVGGGRVDLDVEQHPVLDREVPRRENVRARADRIGLHVREVAELTEVDADHRHVGTRHQGDGAQHRAVPAQAHGHVRASGQDAVGAREVTAPGPVGVLDRKAGLVAETLEPSHRLECDLCGLETIVVNDDDDDGHGQTTVPCTVDASRTTASSVVETAS